MGNPWESINTLVLKNLCESPVAKSRRQEACIQFRECARRGSFQFIKKKRKKKGSVSNILLIHLY